MHQQEMQTLEQGQQEEGQKELEQQEFLQEEGRRPLHRLHWLALEGLGLLSHTKAETLTREPYHRHTSPAICGKRRCRWLITGHWRQPNAWRLGSEFTGCPFILLYAFASVHGDFNWEAWQTYADCSESEQTQTAAGNTRRKHRWIGISCWQ